MTSNVNTGNEVSGTLETADGAGVVRIESRYDTSAEDLWEAITDAGRLARWYGEVTGDLREGGQFFVYLAGPDLNGVGHVDRCDPPRQLVVTTRETEESARKGGDEPFEQRTTATLTPDGEQTALVVEIRGLPLGRIASYGVGWQLHVESLMSYLTGRPAPDVGERWGDLAPIYDTLAAQLE